MRLFTCFTAIAAGVFAAFAFASAALAGDNTSVGNGNYTGNIYDNHGTNITDNHSINGSFNGGNSTINGGIKNAGGQGGQGGRGGDGGDGGTGIGVGTGFGGAGGNARADGGKAESAANNSLSINEEAQRRNPVSTAWSAPLVAAEDTCMGSTSAGGQGVGFGLSLGSTWTDKDCVRRKNARELYNMGKKKVAITLLCHDAEIAQAFAESGDFSCPAKPTGYNESQSSNRDFSLKSEYPTGGRKGSRR